MVDKPQEQIELAIPIDQSTNQSINQSINQHGNTGTQPSVIDQSINQRINQSINAATDAVSQPIGQSIDQSIKQSTNDVIDQPGPFVEPVKPDNQSINQSIDIDDELLIPIHQLINQSPYNSSINGLSETESIDRLMRDGPNEFQSIKPVPLWLAYFYQLANLLICLLIVSSIVAYALSEYVEATAIMVVVLLNTNLAVFTERKADNALAALAALSNPVANVIRHQSINQPGETGNGASGQGSQSGDQSINQPIGQPTVQPVQIDSRNLVVGDMIVLHTGDVVPADCRVVTCASLDINEMILTGESLPVRKHVSINPSVNTLTPQNMLLSGTSVQNGNAIAMVVATGSRTKLGEIARLMDQSNNQPKPVVTKQTATDGPTNQSTAPPKEPNAIQRAWRKLFSRQPVQTDMQKSVQRLGAGLSSIAVVVCILVLVIGIARNHQNPDHPDEEVWLSMLLVAVSLAVSAIPEGLPLALTVTLSLGGQRLAKCNALVRRIAAVENLGAVNVICTDKTGTLTEGRMSVVQLAIGAQVYSTFGDHITLFDDEDDNQSINPSFEKVVAPGEAVCPEESQSAVPSANTSSPPAKRSFFGKLFPPRAIQTSRSSEGLNEHRRAEDAFAAQTVNEAKRDHDAVSSKAYMREALVVTRVATLCSNAKLITDSSTNQKTASGNPTEAAIVLLADKVGLHAEEALRQNPRVLELPFSSQRKMMFTVHDLNASDHIAEILGKNDRVEGRRLYLTCGKGSCDMLLPFCTKYFAGHESVEEMNDTYRSSVFRQMEEMASQALRVIAVVGKVTSEAPKSLATIEEEKSGDDDEALWSQQQRNLVFLGLIGIADPPRVGVADAIEVARQAGIRTVMITGDFLITAKAIARNIRLMTKSLVHNNPALGEQAVDCSILRPNGEYLPDDQLDALVPNCIVFARAQPRDKLEIVRSLQRQNLVTAMTGDGTNDTPSLSAADVGIAMGSGTDVAKGASAIVLLDDNFSTIITAIKEGRSIYANIQKFIVFLVATNSTQMALILFCIIAGLPVPMSPLQILAINIITDGLPALALSAMPSENDVMKASPRNRSDFVITGHLRWICFFHALWLVVILPIVFVVALYWSTGAILQDDILGLVDNGNPTAPGQTGCRVYDGPGAWSRVFDADCEAEGVRIGRTAVFLTLALAENARPYTVRWLYHIFWHQLLSNVALLGASALSVACLFIIMFVPPVMGIFGTDYLPWYIWVFVLGCAALTVILDEIVKYFLYQKGVDHSVDKELPEVEAVNQSINQSNQANKQEIKQ